MENRRNIKRANDRFDVFLYQAKCSLFLISLFLYLLCLPQFAVAAKTCSPEIKDYQFIAPLSDQTYTQLSWRGQTTEGHSWQQQHERAVESAWYRIVWDKPCHGDEPTVIVLQSLSVLGEVYLNDELLWQPKNQNNTQLLSWNTPRYWVLTAKQIRQQNNEIKIHVQGSNFHSSGLGSLAILPFTEGLQRYETWYWQQIKIHQVKWIVSLVLAIVALSIFLFHPGQQNYFWLALSMLLWACYLINFIFENTPFYWHELWFEYFSLIAFTGYVCCHCIFVMHLTECFKLVFKHILIFCFVLNIVAALLLNKDAAIGFLPIFFALWLIILSLNSLFLLWISFQAKRIQIYVLAAAQCSYTPTLIYTIWHRFDLESTAVWFPYIDFISIIFMLMLLVLQIMSHIHQLKQQHFIAVQSQQSTHSELLQCFSKDRENDAEKIKVQERVALAQDLHDGVGGAILRLIYLIEHDIEPLRKAKILMLLKLIKDDLRNIVDYGASFNRHLPDSPIIWLAPLRYRFSEIFDVANIHLEWKVDTVWLAPITIQECLLLQRIIEEALTNIFKHSSANHAQLRFSLEQQLLLLIIQDNGRGFDLNSVEAGNLGIGLLSIKKRVKNLEAQLNIISREGCTMLEIRKVLLAVQPR